MVQNVEIMELSRMLQLWNDQKYKKILNFPEYKNSGMIQNAKILE